MVAARARRWPIADDVVPLEAGRLRLYLLYLDAAAGLLESRADILSEDERQRRDRFHFQVDRNRFATTRTCLRLVLGRLLAVDPGDIHFNVAEFGKPYVEGSEVRFNIAHSGRLALLGFGRDTRVGVDVEEIKDETVSSALARSVFSSSEIAKWRELGAEERQHAFFDIWTRKEALLKATGVGLSVEPRGLSLELEDDQSFDVTFAEPPTWHIRSMEAPEGFSAAVCCPGGSLDFDCWTVDAEQLAAGS